MTALDRILTGYDPEVVARGRRYAIEGRVVDLAEEKHEIRASVRGTRSYDVTVRALDTARPRATCTCPAYERLGECKHVAALAWALSRRDRPASKVGAMPAVFDPIYSTAAFFARLSLYAGEPLVPEIAEARTHWSPLRDYWIRAEHDEHAAHLVARAIEHAPEITAVVQALRKWKPPAVLGPLGPFVEKLAEQYREHRTAIEIRHALPGPLDDRHPGFELHYDPKKRLLTLEEKWEGVGRAKQLALEVPLDPEAPIAFADQAFTDLGGVADAWELFALRAMIERLARGEGEDVQRLGEALARPVWDHVLDALARPVATPDPREWCFCLADRWGPGEWKLTAWSRGAGKNGKWKRQPMELLLAEGTPLEREIGKLALCSTQHKDHVVTLGTPHAHALLGLLGDHPRVRLANGYTPNPDADPVTAILAGPLTLRFEDEKGTLRPRFRIGNTDLPIPLEALLSRVQRGKASPIAAGAWSARGETYVCSALVDPQVRPWLEMAQKLGSSLRFPPEAVPRLVTTTQSLIAAGTVHLPREALGEERPYEPRAALRVAWRTDADEVTAQLEVLVAVHPGAPLIEAGAGPRLFTFDDEGQRVFVEREMDRERDVVARAIDAMPRILAWEDTVGHTPDAERTLALAAYLEENPLGLTIELKVGRPPRAVEWPSARSQLDVRRVDAWLTFSGSIEVEGQSLTVGEILEAARLARRYVRAGNGVFLELSKDAIAKLAPLAMAAELAPLEAPAIHMAFEAFLAAASSVFTARTGLDPREVTRRFEKRAKVTRAPRLEHGTLRAYQEEGARWMLALASWAPGCVLADDMGLGKTVQTAAVLAARSRLGPALVIAPASVTSNWTTELARFVPSLSVRWHHADRDLTTVGPGDVVVVSYGLLQRTSEFADVSWSTVVVDEAQYVKNAGAQRSDAVRSLPRDFTIALTGTPLENHLGELHSIVDLVFPGLLGDETRFRERFRRPIEQAGDTERLAVLGRLLGPFLMRRTRAAVLEELPPREEITSLLELSSEERRRYVALREAVQRDMRARSRRETTGQMRIALLAALTRLRQLACDVRLVDPSYDGAATKIARATELVEQIVAEGNKVLVFSQFTQFLALVNRALAGAGLRVGMLTGETPTERRRAIVDAFQRGEFDVFCISLLAGGTGLNLTNASYVVHLDPWWNPAVEEQATSRSHRMGQAHPVTVYRLVSRGTIEEAVLSMHAAKRALAASVLEGKGSPKSMSSTELLELLRYGE
jgi:superfamily II DNA or RNA helicase